MASIPHPDCQLATEHEEHMFTVLAGPNAGARVDCPGLDWEGVRLETVLDNIIVTAQQVKEAIADEHEGNVKLRLDRLYLDALRCHVLVSNW